MALQIALDATQSPDGDAAAQAYARVYALNLVTTPRGGAVQVYFYRRASAAAAGRMPVMVRSYDLPAAVVNAVMGNVGAGDVGDTLYNALVTRLYLYLKTLPDFQGATDV